MSNLAEHHTPKGQNNWIDSDTRKLKELAGTISKEEIAVILKTTVERVISKSAAQGFKLGVKS